MQNSPRIILLLEAIRGFDRGLLFGVARYAALNGPWTFYRQPHGYLRSKRGLDLKELQAWKPDGAICPVTQLDELSLLRVPLIAYDVNERSGRVPCVLSEDFQAGRLAAQHLLEFGHRHFAFCGYSGIRWSRERCQAFCDVIQQGGCTVEVYRPRSRRPAAWAKEEPHVRHWLETLPKPIGMLCANDDRAAAQNPGLLVFKGENRHRIGTAITPFDLGFEAGSILPTGTFFSEFDFGATSLLSGCVRISPCAVVARPEKVHSGDPSTRVGGGTPTQFGNLRYLRR